MRGDLIKTNRILRRPDRVDAERLFPLVGKSRTRGHNLRVRVVHLRAEEEILLSDGSKSVEFFTAAGCRGCVKFSIGGADGIGKAYAEELASQGINLILISHDRSKLEATAIAISETFNIETIIIEADFTKGREMYQPIREALKDKEIGILVNSVDVPYEHPRFFLNASEDELWDLINVNIAATNMMIHILLPGMIQRKKGAIVNISSGSCCKPTPQMATYSSTQTYLDHFSRALHFEYASKGIFVQSLLPFYVKNNSASHSDGFCIYSWIAPSANVYARHAISTLGISHRTSGYWMHSIQFLFAQYMPEWLWVWGATLMNNRSCRKAACTS
ncbi:inactive hydroxysteroid dehydrogenase-like protein 1 isoform X1 [Mustelus asterias]